MSGHTPTFQTRSVVFRVQQGTVEGSFIYENQLFNFEIEIPADWREKGWNQILYESKEEIHDRLQQQQGALVERAALYEELIALIDAVPAP